MELTVYSIKNWGWRLSESQVVIEKKEVKETPQMYVSENKQGIIWKYGASRVNKSYENALYIPSYGILAMFTSTPKEHDFQYFKKEVEKMFRKEENALKKQLAEKVNEHETLLRLVEEFNEQEVNNDTTNS